MKRRALLKVGAGAAALVLAGPRLALADLEPDRMWSIYRRYRLMIVGQHDDEIAIAFAGAVVDVLAGFLSDDHSKAYGRPVGVTVTREGTLLVADDVGNAIWHVTARDSKAGATSGSGPQEKQR